MTLKLGITMLCHGVRESVDKEVGVYLLMGRLNLTEQLDE